MNDENNAIISFDQIEKTFNPQEVEQKWYKEWEDKKSFSPKKSKIKKNFSLIMPPPNVTGKLHMGHALDNTCQDILTRFKRMSGFQTLWIPGCDHAGIATQSVVEKKLFKEKKLTKHDLGREKFLEEIWNWKNESGHQIVDQLKKLGASCDWDYFTFTMDPIPNQAVKKFFVTLFNEGLIYQAEKIINWDPTLQSAISDAEVEYKEVKGKFYHLKYQIVGSDQFLEVATTRPETLFGDTAVAVNPNDPRFKDLIGKNVIIPICKREIPIIADEHVDLEIGTGCLKVTPGHDFNDFEIGQRHHLPIINILNKDGSFNSEAAAIEGLKGNKAREKTVALLEEQNLIVKIVDHVHQVGHGERSDSIIEPMVSKQWFLNVKSMSQKAVESVENQEMTFFPKSWENTYFSWLKEPRDWCLSRQLWWGHQIPVYNCDSCNHQWALESTPAECPKCKHDQITQDQDVLDTWFSSGLWPLSTLGWPDKKLMKEKKFSEFYPNSTLVTAFDIIFFWVARMMMSCLYITQKAPFHHTYIHGLVRDKQGRKMSKSLGNGIDPIDMINQYGCDAVRFTLSSGAGYSRGLNLDPERIEGFRNFINKIWNAFRFCNPFIINTADKIKIDIKKLDTHEKWIIGELNSSIKSVTQSIEQYRFDDASSELYVFIYDKFCSWFIELSKNILNGSDEIKKTQRAIVLKYVFQEFLKLIHPFTPFITEEIWSQISNKNKSLLIDAEYPIFQENYIFENEQKMMNHFTQIITQIRNLRSNINLKPKEEIDIIFFINDRKIAHFLYENRFTMRDLAKVKSGKIRSKNQLRPKKSVMNTTAECEIYLPLEGLIDINEEINRVKKQIDKTQKDLLICEQKLSNQNFIDRAPQEIVSEIKDKVESYKSLLDSLSLNLQNLQ